MRKVGFVMLVLVLMSFVLARGSYRLQLINQFNLIPDRGDVRTITCQYCHASPDGGAPWNAFGNEVRANFRGSIGEALYETLKAMKDSDGDGFIDVLEVFAGTLPGDASSRPLVTPQFLMQSLEKVGGLEIYKPR